MTSWLESPCVWPSWKCQLLNAERSARDVVVDAVVLEPLRSARTIVTAGAPFAVRVARDDDNEAALDALTGWADDLQSVLILGGRHRRQSWMCVSRRHERLVLNGTTWAIRPTPDHDARGQRPATGEPLLVAPRTLIDARGEPR
jgi:hypothetical protein